MATGRAGTVTVAVMGDDGVSIEDLCAHLRRVSDVRVVPWQGRRTADVLLVLADCVDARLISELRAVLATPRQRVVLVAETLSESYLPELIGCGVVSILPRQLSTHALLARVVVESRDGVSVLPNSITHWLIDHVRVHYARVLAVAGRQAAIFSAREIDLLRLLAEGCDTVEIAERLNYSTRTIKKILHGIMTRFQLRNRAHAVSFAIRIGAI